MQSSKGTAFSVLRYVRLLHRKAESVRRELILAPGAREETAVIFEWLNINNVGP